jgi:glucose/arabinose dehydrogenase
MTFLDKNTIIFTQRQGQVKTLNLKNRNITTINGLPKIYAKGQGGLLDVAFSDYQTTAWICFTYNITRN